MKKSNKSFSINELKNIIKEVAETYSYIWECWDGGNKNIDCHQIDTNIYIVRLKSADTTSFDLIKDDISIRLNQYGYFIIDEGCLKPKARWIKTFFISNKKDVRKYQHDKMTKSKQVYKKCMIGCQNSVMDNSINTKISSSLNLHLK